MSIKRHTLQNLAGALVPIAFSLAIVPVYLHVVGVARYGVLALVWLVVGYFGLFDLGLARATAYHVARLHNATNQARSQVFMNATFLNFCVGMVGAMVLYAALPWLLHHGLKIPASLMPEMRNAPIWIASAVPLFTLNGVFLGALEGRQRFDLLNITASLSAILLQAVPLAVALLHGPSLRWLIPAVVLARVLGTLGTLACVQLALPITPGGLAIHRRHIAPLLRYGGWISVSSLAGNALVALDRILIAASLGVVAVGYYTVPYNLVNRAGIFPGAVSTSLFPRLSQSEQAQSAALAARASATLAAVFTPIILAGALAIPLFMRLWVGAAFASHATPVALLLLVGVWANGLAYVPFAHLQAGGAAARTAWLHLLELPLFIAMLWLGLHFYGLVGAAIAWSLRCVGDALAVFLLAGLGGALRTLWPGLLLVLGALVLAWLLSPAILWLPGLAVLVLAALWAYRLVPDFTLRNLWR